MSIQLPGDLQAFHAQLVRLSHADIPLGLGWEELAPSPEEAVARISEILGPIASDPAALLDKLAAQREKLPVVYRHVLEAGLRCGDLMAPFVELQRVVAERERRPTWSSTLAYPLSVVILALVGIASFVRWSLPTLLEFTAAMRLELGSLQGWLELLQSTMPVWLALPFVVVGVTLLRRSLRPHFLRREQKVSAVTNRQGWWGRRAEGQLRGATWAAELATLRDHGLAESEATRLAQGIARGGPSHDPLSSDRGSSFPALSRTNWDTTAGASLTGGVAAGEVSYLGTAQQAATTAVSQHASRRGKSELPLIEVILNHYGSSGVDPRLWRLVADDYLAFARQRAGLQRAFLPSLCLIVMGGAATLFYGWVLFGPLVRILEEIAHSTSSGPLSRGQ